MARLTPAPAEMERADFIARFGGVYERSPWAAARAWEAGLGPETADPERLAAAMHAQVAAAGRTAQLALLRAHPDLAGKLELAQLTEESRGEQAGAGLDQGSSDELAEFRALNDRYGARFGFPFILAVKGRHRREILAAFRARVENAPEDEFAEALEQVRRIALMRIAAMAG